MLKTIQNMVYPCPKNPFPWPDPWAETGTSETGSDIFVTEVKPMGPCPDGPTRPDIDDPDYGCQQLGTVDNEVFDPVVDTNITDTGIGDLA